jgi:hypothetical protein
MNIKDHNPGANVPKQPADEPRGDRGSGDKTWSPDDGEQGISNRVEDEDDNEFNEDEDESEDEEDGDDLEDIAE